MNMPGKSKGKGVRCKVNLRYIEDDKKRSDALYKRRKGLMKKAYELSVLCGLKISIFGTDFDKICFSFCNDSRLQVDLEQLFRELNNPLWMTDFNQLIYPYNSVKGLNKKKLLYGLPLEPSVSGEQLSGGGEPPTVGSSVPDYKSDSFLSKRPKSVDEKIVSSILIGPQELDRLKTKNKKLKIGKIKQPPQQDSSPLTNVFLSFKPNLYVEKITAENIDDNLCFSMKKVIAQIKANRQLTRYYKKADPQILEKLTNFNTFMLNKMSRERFFFNYMILRSFFWFYFDTREWLPFSNIKKIKLSQMIKLVGEIEKAPIDKVLEILIQIIFQRIEPAENFDLHEEANKVDFCIKLYSLKRVHTRRRLVAMAFKGGKSKALYKHVNEFLKTKALDKQTVARMSFEMAMKFRLDLIVMEECWYILSVNEMIAIQQVNLAGSAFFQRLPDDDLKKFAGMLSDQDLSKLPIVMEVLTMEKERNERLKAQQYRQFINNNNSTHKDKNQKEVDSRSITSDFSFNFDGRSVSSFSLF